MILTLNNPRMLICHNRKQRRRDNRKIVQQCVPGYPKQQASGFQILDETDCISHSTNTLGKGMNPIILPPAMGK